MKKNHSGTLTGKKHFHEQVGNIRIFTEGDESVINVSLYNGLDLVFQRCYADMDVGAAIIDSMEQIGYYTQDYFLGRSFYLKKTANTYHSIDGEDWYCRVDDSKWFYHFHKKEHEFIKDKYGKRIIDR